MKGFPEPFSKCWPIQTLMNQSHHLEGVRDWDPSSCTGFSRAHALMAEPQTYAMTHLEAYQLYRRAKELDKWPGEDYEGSSVLAAVQAAQERQLIASYWWALTYEEFVSSISNVGPGVVGSWWLQGMFDADERGFIETVGPEVGGHAYCIGGVLMELNAAVIYQSWGEITHIIDQGIKDLLVKHGLPFPLYRHVQLIDLDDLWELMQVEGEYCVSLDTVPTEPLPEPSKPGCLSMLRGGRFKRGRS